MDKINLPSDEQIRQDFVAFGILGVVKHINTFKEAIATLLAENEKLRAVVEAASAIHHYHKEWDHRDCEGTPLVYESQLEELGKALAALEVNP